MKPRKNIKQTNKDELLRILKQVTAINKFIETTFNVQRIMAKPRKTKKNDYWYEYLEKNDPRIS